MTALLAILTWTILHLLLYIHAYRVQGPATKHTAVKTVCLHGFHHYNTSFITRWNLQQHTLFQVSLLRLDLSVTSTRNNMLLYFLSVFGYHKFQLVFVVTFVSGFLSLNAYSGLLVLKTRCFVLLVMLFVKH